MNGFTDFIKDKGVFFRGGGGGGGGGGGYKKGKIWHRYNLFHHLFGKLLSG